MHILTVDFESFYDSQYSLSKMTTEEYVRDPRFETIGVSVQVDDNPPEWCSGDDTVIAAFLNQYDWDSNVAVAHNAMFDMAIMSWRYGIRPKRIADTLSMARALLGTEVGVSLKALVEHYGLGAKGTEVINALGKRRASFTPEELARYGDYCCNDTALTYALFCRMCAGFPVSELKLIDVTIRMFTEPTLVLDSSLLTDHLREVQEKKAKLLNKAMFDKDRLMSNPQLADLLRTMGVEPPMKISPTTGLETYAFAKSDEEFKALLEHEDVLVQAVVAARLGVKSTLEETRTERFLQIAERGPLPVQLRYYAAHTGRWGGDGKLNLQNLPRGGKLKQSILAPEGHVFIDSDSSQIEARVLAWLAGQDDLVEAFANGEDVYKIMASAIYGKPEEDINKDERFVGKTTILGCGYGMGAARFQAQLKTFGVDLPFDECARIISVYRETYPEIPKLWKAADAALRAITRDQLTGLGLAGVLRVEGADGILLPNGLYIRYPGLRWHQGDKDGFVYDFKRGRSTFPKGVWGGGVVENCIARGTPVLTTSGWKNIEAIGVDDLVHDGVEFVRHGGVVNKSVQPCVLVDGVFMTPEHEVLTDAGWRAAETNPRPHRPDLRGVNGHAPGAQQRAQTVVALPVLLRRAMCAVRGGRSESSEAGGDPPVRGPRTHRRAEPDPRHVEASSVRGVAQHARQVPLTNPPSVEELRGTGHSCLPGMGEQLRRVLERYGPYIHAGLGLGSRQQQQGVRAGELPVDVSPRELHEQTEHRAQSRRGGPEQRDRDKHHNHILQAGKRMDGGGAPHAPRRTQQPVAQKEVFDILNCGPRSRFVVMGREGPFVVHNCCQALARIVIGEQMLLIAKRYRPVITVHDAVGALAPKAEEAQALAYVETCMRTRPVWAPDLPLNCEAGSGPSYGDC